MFRRAALCVGCSDGCPIRLEDCLSSGDMFDIRAVQPSRPALSEPINYAIRIKPKETIQQLVGADFVVEVGKYDFWQCIAHLYLSRKRFHYENEQDVWCTHVARNLTYSINVVRRA